jgi:hypothetical protein
MTLSCGRIVQVGIIIVSLASIVGSCRQVTEAGIVMECPSPDGRINAVYWYEKGGGAAGWAEAYVTVLPSQLPSTGVQERERLRNRIFRFAHGYDLRIIWQSADLLEVEYPDSALVNYAAPGGAYTPDLPKLKVRYRGVPANESAGLSGGTWCETAGRRITAGPERELR